MDDGRRPTSDFLASLPPEPDVTALTQEIAAKVSRPGSHVVVLDDDPTGSQTMHDIDIFTTWDRRDLTMGLQAQLFYVLTNSRALDRSSAVARVGEIAENLRAAGAGRGIDIISRSDSTLRGHYPWELAPLHIFGPRAHLIVPAFPEGGRITVDGIHYVQEGEEFVPVGQTEFARDPDFGFTSSYLPAWVEEKSVGQWRASDVLRISLVLLRSGDATAVAHLLAGADRNQPIVSDAVSYADLTVLVAGLLRAEEQGYRFLSRTAASFVKVRGAIADRPLLSPVDLQTVGSCGPGLVLVGSYVQRSSDQLGRALQLPNVVGLELDVGTLLGGSDGVGEPAARWIDEALARDQIPVVYTSRHLVRQHGDRPHLDVGARVSTVLSSIVRHLKRSPRWLVAKGGITSSDVATNGLGVRRARVLGQIATGVSVWRLGPETRYPGMAYIVFPGNVGGSETLAGIIQKLAGSEEGACW